MVINGKCSRASPYKETSFVAKHHLHLVFLSKTYFEFYLVRFLLTQRMHLKDDISEIFCIHVKFAYS